MPFPVSQDFVIDLDRVEEFARTAAPRTPPSPEYNDESGNYFSDLLVLKQNAQIPELKTLFDIVKDPTAEALTPEQKDVHFRALIPKLSLISKKINSGKFRLPPYNEDFPNQFANPSPELSSFLKAVSSLPPTLTDPVTAAAVASLALLDPAKSNGDIAADIMANIQSHRKERSDQADKDVPRLGIKVRQRDQVLEFRDVEQFKIWGAENGLTGEQIGFTTDYAHQSILYAGSFFPVAVHYDKALYPNSVLSGDEHDPTITVDMTKPNEVSILHQERIRGMHSNESGAPVIASDLVISTFSSDITALRSEEFILGLASSPVSFEARITTPDISKFRLLVPDAILAAPDQARTTNLELYARNKIRGAYTTQEIASLFEERLPNLREPLARLRSEDPRFSDDARIVTSTSSALTRDLGMIGADFRIPDKEISDMRLEEIATLRKNLLNIADNLSNPLAKEGLLTMRDDVFQRTIAARPDLRERFVEIEAGKIDTLSEAIGAIKFAPEGRRELYIERTGFQVPTQFAEFCEQAVRKEILSEETLSHEKIRSICTRLTELNAITDPTLITPELKPRVLNTESFVRQIATNNDVPVTGSIFSAAAVVGGIAQGLNYVGGSSPKDILLGETGLLTSKLRDAGRTALTTVGYRRGAGSKTPPLPDSVSPAGGAASSSRTSPGGAAAGVSTPPSASEASPGILSRVTTGFGSLFRRKTPSPEAQAASDRLAAGSSARALQTGIPETRSRAESSSAELAQLAASAPSPDEARASASPAAVAAGTVKASLESPLRGRGRSSAFSEGSDLPESPSRAASPNPEGFRVAHPPRALRGSSAERGRGGGV